MLYEKYIKSDDDLFFPRLLTIVGWINFKCLAAASALGEPPSKESSNVYNGWRTGLENDTLPLSTNEIWRTPQPYFMNTCKFLDLPYAFMWLFY
jgi:hypothetical protein